MKISLKFQAAVATVLLASCSFAYAFQVKPIGVGDDPYAYITVTNNVVSSYQEYVTDSNGDKTSINETKLLTLLPTSTITFHILNSSANWMCYDFVVKNKGVGLILSDGTSFSPTFSISSNITQGGVKACS